MPYIKQEDRARLDVAVQYMIKGRTPANAGELNYFITSILREYMRDNVSYAKLNELVGVLNCVQLELYRRVAAPYEDTKVQENGDVFKFDL